MFRRILVPLDGSARAEQALPIAARIAQASGGSVMLLHVLTATREFGPSLGQAALQHEVIDAALADVPLCQKPHKRTAWPESKRREQCFPVQQP